MEFAILAIFCKVELTKMVRNCKMQLTKSAENCKLHLTVRKNVGSKENVGTCQGQMDSLRTLSYDMVALKMEGRTIQRCTQ